MPDTAKKPEQGPVSKLIGGILGIPGAILGPVAENLPYAIRPNGQISITGLLDVGGVTSAKRNEAALQSKLQQAQVDRAEREAAIYGQRQEAFDAARPELEAKYGKGAVDLAGPQGVGKLLADILADQNADVAYGRQAGLQEERLGHQTKERRAGEGFQAGQQEDRQAHERKQADIRFGREKDLIGLKTNEDLFKDQKTRERDAKADQVSRDRAKAALNALGGDPVLNEALIDVPATLATPTLQGSQVVGKDRADYEALRALVPQIQDPQVKAQATALIQAQPDIGFGSGTYSRFYDSVRGATLPQAQTTEDKTRIPTVLKNKIAEQTHSDHQSLMRLRDVSERLRSGGGHTLFGVGPATREIIDLWIVEPFSPGGMSERTSARLELRRSIEEQIALQMRDLSGATVPPEEVVRLAKAYIAGDNTVSEILLKLDSLAEQTTKRIELNEKYVNGEITPEDAQRELRAIQGNIKAVRGGIKSGKRPEPKAKADISEADFLKMTPEKRQEYLEGNR